MKDELHIDLLEVFVKHQLVPAISLRNEKIRLEYKQMKVDGIKPKEARRLLAEKNFISEKNIESILYNKRNNFELINTNL